MSAPNQLSFLPDDYLENKRQHRTNMICAVLFLVIGTAIGSAFYIVERSLRDAERENDSERKRYTEDAKVIEQARQMQENQRKMAHQAELTASLLEKVPRSFLLAEVTNAMPAGVSLFDVVLDSKVRQQTAPAPKSQFDIKKAAITGGAKSGPTIKAYDVTMKLVGMADTDVQVAQFIARLNQSKLLRDVNLLISDEYQYSDTKVRKFQIEMTVDPAAEIQHGMLNPRTAATEMK